MSDPRRRAVITTPDLSHKAPTLDLPSPFVPERVASLTLPGGADDDNKFLYFPFGLCETEGSIRYAVQYGNYLWIVRALALGEREATIYGGEQAGECDGLVGVYSDTGPFASADFSYTWVSGSLSQTVHATLAGVIAALGGSWAETLVIVDKTGKRRAICHSIECWSNVATRWANGIPKIKYRFRGSRVLNTTTGLVEYTANPWWQARFWALDPSGGRMRPSRINEASFQSAAAASPSTQYESHMLLSASARECRKMFGLLGDGWLVFAGGNQLTAIVDRNTAPVASYDDSHFAADQDIEAGPVADPDQMVNSVTIEYTDTTDPSGVWKTKSFPPFRTAGLIAGTETETPVTYKFPQIHDPAIVNLKGTYLLYSYQAYRIKGKWLANAGGPRLMGDVVTQALPALGISDNFRVMFRDKAPNGTYPVELELIDARKWAGGALTAPAKVGSTLSDPYATPPTPPPVTLAQEGFNIRVTLGTLAPPYDWYGGQIITVQQSGGFAEYELGRPASGDLLIKGVTMGATYTVRSKVVSVLFPLLVGLASTATLTPVMAQIPPDVAATPSVSYVSASLPNGAASIVFSKPFLLSSTLYGSGSLTPTNLHSYDGTKVNDGGLSGTCFDWNLAGASRIAINVGPGKTISYVWIYTSAFAADPIIETSNDGVTWSGGFASNPVGYVADVGGGVSLRIYQAPGGAHPWIAVTKASTLAEATTFTEVWPRETTTTQATANEIARYNVYGFSPPGPGPLTVYDARHFYGSISFGQEPTAAAPFDVNAVAFHNPSAWPLAFALSGQSKYLAVYVTAVSPSGVESPGLIAVTGGFFAFANTPIPIDQITTQGADIASAATTDIGASSGWEVNVTGTTTITSLGTKTAGVMRHVTFAGALTLTHNATSLILPGSANIITAAGDTAVFESLGSGNWKCFSYTRAATAPWSLPTIAQPVGIGVVPDSASGMVLDVGLDSNGVKILRMKNPNAGNAAAAQVRTESDTVVVSQIAHSSTRAVTRDGQSLAGWAELFASAANGLKLSTASGAPIGLNRLVGMGTAPTAAVIAGGGTGATATVDTGSTDLAGTITITAGTTPPAFVTIRLTFSAALGANPATVLITAKDGSGQWDRVVAKLVNSTPTTSKFEVNLDNNAVNLLVSATYQIQYLVIGK